MDNDLKPGEARNRARRNRKIAFLIIAAIVGAAIGAFMSIIQTGDGDLFLGEVENLTVPAWAAIAMAIAFLAAFGALPLWGFTQIDDYLVRHNLIAYAAGCITVVAGYPTWAALAMGGLVPFPTAFDLFALAFLATILVFAVVKLRA